MSAPGQSMYWPDGSTAGHTTNFPATEPPDDLTPSGLVLGKTRYTITTDRGPLYVLLGTVYDDSDRLHIRNFKPENKVGIVQNTSTKQVMYLRTSDDAWRWSVANEDCPYLL
jgi:hypothetical protein